MITITLLVTLFITCALYYWYSRRRLRYLASKLPGPPTLPLVGNSLLFVGTAEKMFKNSSRIVNTWAPIFRLWLGPILVVALSDPRDIEIVLRNSKYFEKGWVYNFLRPWLGKGLITASGERWHKHRKLITPTFHFKILEQFVPIFEANCNILVEKLRKTESEVINIAEYMELYSLDTICETAMGYQPQGQLNERSPYVDATKKVSEIMQKRVAKIWLYNDFLFNWTTSGQELKKSLKIIHGISTEIVKRKMEQLKTLKSQGVDIKENESIGEKKKMAFLDHLLHNSADDNDLTVQDIREEVDTFLFTGHDTTTSLLSFTLFLLGHHQSIQEEAYQEVRSVVGDSERSITYNDLSKLKYVERCLLETLRVYPTVSVLPRSCKAEIKMRDHVLPAGCIVLIFIMKLHKNPEFFPDPITFNPDRFLPENISKRHPYSFIPFSAGPRNCIGQKYGMIQAKYILATILRNFHITPGCKRRELRPVSHIVTKSANGIPIILKSRHKSSQEHC
ncbi:hypothetical protein L9F63_012002 [Diploptera punctata]|uniref:Cytochrome P450 n=1 Tax=Diploptera punctata TaxID=6984 RepID=A0AAD8AER6_DIPPU|nr:hypothetical protein L9F63_012002 [Diploptera punctata]